MILVVRYMRHPVAAAKNCSYTQALIACSRHARRCLWLIALLFYPLSRQGDALFSLSRGSPAEGTEDARCFLPR